LFSLSKRGGGGREHKQNKECTLSKVLLRVGVYLVRKQSYVFTERREKLLGEGVEFLTISTEATQKYFGSHKFGHSFTAINKILPAVQIQVCCLLGDAKWMAACSTRQQKLGDKINTSQQHEKG